MLREKAKVQQTGYEVVMVEELVPKDHLLRKVEQAVDFSFIHDMCKDLYCPDNGRPAIAVIPCFHAIASARSKYTIGPDCTSGSLLIPHAAAHSSSGIADTSCFVLYSSCRRCSFRLRWCRNSTITDFASSCTSFFLTPLSNMYCSPTSYDGENIQ